MIDIIQFGILTISDAGSKGERADTSGDAIGEIMAREGCDQVCRDIVPDERGQISAVLDVEAPGIAEAMRIETLKSTPFAMLSRSVSGVRSGCLVINLPGSPTGVRECLEVALPAIPHAVNMIRASQRPAHPSE